ncbi:SGM_5486 family transporter-associated protein [Streptomyces sp. 4N509B]
MPALDPHPTGGQRTLLMILGAMLTIGLVIAVVAVVASP